MRLGARARDAGFRLKSLGEVGSTNDIALERARAGDSGKLWIVASTQRGGRGRLGRAWASPEGNLYASLLLVDPAPPSRAAELGFVAGVALMDAFGAAGAPDGAVKLKWPNDALYRGAKISGALLEATTRPDGALACVVGLGVNCVSHPDGLAWPATDFAAEGHAITREALFGALSDAFAARLAQWRGGDGFAEIRAAWMARAARLGERVTVTQGETRREGIFRGVDERGFLLLENEAGTSPISAGDVLWPFPMLHAPESAAGNS